MGSGGVTWTVVPRDAAVSGYWELTVAGVLFGNMHDVYGLKGGLRAAVPSQLNDALLSKRDAHGNTID